jgi:hypothetical protein
VPGCTASPPSSSRPTAAFALQLLLPTCRAITALPPPRGSRSACIRVAPSVALSSMASDQCIVHHRSWLHFSCGQHFVEHLSCILDTANLAPPRHHRGVGVLVRVDATAFPHLAHDLPAHQLGRGLSSPSGDTAMRCTSPSCTSSLCT